MTILYFANIFKFFFYFLNLMLKSEYYIMIIVLIFKIIIKIAFFSYLFIINFVKMKNKVNIINN